MRVKVQYKVGEIVRFLRGELVREDANFVVIRGMMGDLFTIKKDAIFERVDFENGGQA